MPLRTIRINHNSATNLGMRKRIRSPRRESKRQTMKHTWMYWLKKVLRPHFCLIAVAFAAHAPLARALTGNELLTSCNSIIAAAVSGDTSPATPKSEADRVTCSTFLDAVFQTHNVYSSVLHVERQYCTPDNVTKGQVILVLSKWAKENPEKLHWDGAAVLLLALKGAFPCQVGRQM